MSVDALDDRNDYFAFSTGQYETTRALIEEILEGSAKPATRSAVDAAKAALSRLGKTAETYSSSVMLRLADPSLSTSARRLLEARAVLWHRCMSRLPGVCFGSNLSYAYVAGHSELFHKATVQASPDVATLVLGGGRDTVPVYLVSRASGAQILDLILNAYREGQSRELGWEKTVEGLQSINALINDDADYTLAFTR